MRLARQGTIVFALALVALLAPMLAAASVPDPTWIPGMYDGGDADEILTLVWDGTPAVAADAPALLEPQAVVLVPSPLVAPAPPRLARPARSRAPPLV
jgi:hypothetical protein